MLEIQAMLNSVYTEFIEVLTAIIVGILAAGVLSGVAILIILYRTKLRQYVSSGKTHEITKTTNSSNQKEKLQMKSLYHNYKTNEHSSEHEQAKAVDGDYNAAVDILDDDQWLDDVSGLIPHCLAILKHCRSLTERLATLTMGLFGVEGASLTTIVDSARRISTTVDDMVTAMYPPLNPHLLEARATALILAVTHLAVIGQYECQKKSIPFDWIEHALVEMDNHLAVLRDTSGIDETVVRLHSYDDETVHGGNVNETASSAIII